MGKSQYVWNEKISYCKPRATPPKTEKREVSAISEDKGERWLYMDEGIMDMLREYRKYYFKRQRSTATNGMYSRTRYSLQRAKTQANVSLLML